MDKKHFRTRGGWRRWLMKNYKTSTQVWLVYYKKHTKKPSISYNDAVEEAICFGWIDGKVKSIDDRRYMQRYTPRKNTSVWSLVNKKRAEGMIKEGLMKDAGFEKIKAAKKTGKWQAAYSTKEKPKLPNDLKKSLKGNKKAWENFAAFTNSQQFQYVYWVLQARKKETRENRIKEVVKRASINRKPGIM